MKHALGLTNLNIGTIVTLTLCWLATLTDSGRILPGPRSSLDSFANQRPIDIYWNTSNPLFYGGTQTTDNRIVYERDDVVVNVNTDRGPFEYDQVNIICPTRSNELNAARQASERFIIYSVSQAEYEDCRVEGDRPKIVAVCDNPDNFMYFTITFRSFSPSPRQLEFKPGESYYFLSTSSPVDLQARQGGYCDSHHMKLIFRVAETSPGLERYSSTEADLNQLRPAFWSKYWLSRVPDARDIYSHRIDLGTGQLDLGDPRREMLRSRSPRGNSAPELAKLNAGLIAFTVILIVSMF